MQRGEVSGAAAGKVLGLIFFHPSVRTRVSCESAMARMGGHAISLNPGKDTWNFEHVEGITMDGNTQEHVKELAPVLTRLCHAVGIRKSELITTGNTRAEVTGSYEELARDEFMNTFAKYRIRSIERRRRAMAMAGRKSGSVTYRNCVMPVAPSTRAAS